jgi:hypothetical protein
MMRIVRNVIDAWSEACSIIASEYLRTSHARVNKSARSEFLQVENGRLKATGAHAKSVANQFVRSGPLVPGFTVLDLSHAIKSE